jgi:hypothetical protein
MFKMLENGVHRGVNYFICQVIYPQTVVPGLKMDYFLAYIELDEKYPESNDIGEDKNGNHVFEYIDVPYGVNFYSEDGHSKIPSTERKVLVGWDYGHIGMENTSKLDVCVDVKTAIDNYLSKKEGKV